MFKIFSSKSFSCRVAQFLIASLIFGGMGFVFFTEPSVPVAHAQPNDAEADTWITNGSVSSIVSTSDTIYIGGDFTYVGPDTGCGAVVDANSGAVTPPYTEVDPAGLDKVYAAVPDGSGGWYIGGAFFAVKGVTRNRIAHILADGSLDAQWNPNADSTVFALAVSGSDIYVAGAFTTIGGQSRNGLAKLNNTNGNADLTWDPNPDSGVNSLAVSGSDIYVGGYFTTIGGQSRNNLAKLNNTNGNADASWDPSPDAGVNAIAINGSDTYVSGFFTTIGGQSINGLAKLDSGGYADPSWNPNPDNIVSTLAVNDSVVFAGGRFTTIGGASRNYLAALDAGTGLATSWDPNPNSWVMALALAGSKIFVGGQFISIGGYVRNYIAAINKATGVATSWDPNADNGVLSLYLDGSTLYAGGKFTTIGGQPRNYIAALDTGTGLATTWDPNFDDQVNTLAVSGSTVYAGGRFKTVNGVTTRYSIAAIDAGTGLATVWNPDSDGFVDTLAVSGSTVYVGGFFTSFNAGGVLRNNIAAFATSSDVPTAWDPDADAEVYTLAVSGSTVYLGGSFTTFNAGGVTRNHVAAIPVSSNTPTAWDPDVNNIIYALAVSGSDVYIGGIFTAVNGGSVSRSRIGAVDITTGVATAWDPGIAGTPLIVRVINVSGSTVYAGGGFIFVGTHQRPNFAQFGSDPKMSDTLTRQKISTAANHTIEITLADDVDWAANATLTLTFQSDFNLGALASTDANDFDINTGTEETIIDSGTACGASDAIKLTSIAGQVITFTACPSYTPPGTNSTITIQIGTNATTGGTGDSQIVNPTLVGTYTVSLAGTIGDTNSAAVYIVSDDSTTITATIDPLFTFSISSTSCALGILDTGSISTCNYTLSVGTNAVSGAVITIQAISDGTNAKLNSDANPAAYISDVADGAVTIGSEEYGLEITSLGSGWTAAGTFATEDNAIPDTLTSFLTTTGPIDSGVTSTVTHRASISVTTPAGNYTQTVRYIATGTF